MEQGFIDILQKFISEQGKEALLNESKCEALLADYTKGEYKKESRFLLQALEAGVPKEIDDAKDLRECKKQQIKLLHEEYGLDEKFTADVVNTLALVLRGDTAVVEIQDANGELSKVRECIAKYQNHIFARESHTVVLYIDNTVVAVGSNKEGQCNVTGWRDIAAVVAGSCHTVGLKADGTVVAVGENNKGQCNVTGWRNIVAVAACYAHTVGLKSDGTVVAVGENNKGQCNVTGWRDIAAVATSLLRTVGLKTDGTVVAVGINENGQCNVDTDMRKEFERQQQEFETRQQEKKAKVEKEEKAKAEQEQRKREMELKRLAWQQQGLCQYCGGKLGGIFTKKCKSCGKAN